MELTSVALGGLGGAFLAFLANFCWSLYRERAESRLARLLVRDEIRANIVALEIAAETGELPDLESRTYQDLQLIAARHLPSDPLHDMRAAYIHVRVPRSLERHDSFGGVHRQKELLAAALAKARTAEAALDNRHVPKRSVRV